jgi:aryl-alcohol dehydrogenase-like predicted oxidoreductase
LGQSSAALAGRSEGADNQDMDFRETVTLGRTGLKVGRLGIASGYGAPPQAIEMAFERGCNYLTWGTFIKGYSPHMAEAIRRIAAKGQRDRMVLAMFSYAHEPFFTEKLFARGLRKIGLDHADVLILGYFNHRPNQRVIDGALKMKEKGLVRFIGLSSHKRKLFPELQREGVLDVFHVRYSAVNRGAETDTFPQLSGSGTAAVVSFTATAWGKLLRPARMPAGETPFTAADCYRFALSHPAVDVCMMGTRTVDEMRQNLSALDRGPLDDAALARARRIGDHIYGRPRIA